MNEVMQYLRESHIDATLVYRYELGGEIISFKIYDCDISVPTSEDLCIDSFKKEVNKQYFKHLENKVVFHKSMYLGFDNQVENYKPII